ncbi:MAG: ABC transporter ATP-binding protein [Proteobacteria bacterium]|nr:ABC transporter ATP-binding protein [Pseudomonadota bacterium]NDC23270.1 ABC transporter ATP-binding protein [Pseudomonadota bacterium]NDD03488.1 ABC transporter ATP-binding protein [Pseudomonadota bacterium]NDG25875.1 ABC transporter ATP-binding protein [Pseudomonadota bacterium]
MKQRWIELKQIRFSYGEKTALDGLSLEVNEGELFCIVGPNGGGKSTTFKILSTLIQPHAGSLSFWGEDGVRFPQRIRPHLGVVFQSPALDKKLTVEENLFYQGKLYGLTGKKLKEKTAQILARFELSDRKQDKVETLSGGLKRRVEITKSLLQNPKLLILDEPTTGLDPIARREVWDHLKMLRKEEGVTVVFTTHLMDEAESADRTALLDRGRVVVSGTPSELKSLVGGDVIALKTNHPIELKNGIHEKFQLEAKLVDQELRIQQTEGAKFIPALVEAFPHQIQSVTLGKPTLEDLFVLKTGHHFWKSETRPA